MNNQSSFSPSHISLYSAILISYQDGGCSNPFRVSRQELMRLSSIKSFATYHIKLNELIDLDLLKYWPSYDPFRASRVELKEIKIKNTTTQLMR